MEHEHEHVHDSSCPSCHVNASLPWWKNKVFILTIVYLLVIGSNLFFPLLEPLRIALISYIKVIIVPVLIGLLLGGVIDWLVPSEYISFLLAAKKKRTIVYSVLTGFLMAACSHGILALSIQIYKKGASVPAVIAFLLASPWANLPLTILMFGFFGWKALYIVLSAIVIALITGYVFVFLENRKLIESNPNTITVEADFSLINDIKSRLKQNKFSLIESLKAIYSGSMSLANMVLWWIMLGALFASIAAAYVPAGFMHHYMGPTIVGLLVTLFIATVIEVCSEGSAPLAFEIYRQTGALGNSFVFLMAGVVTDYTEIGLIWTNIGWKAAVWLPIVSVPQVILLGILANLIF